MILIISHKSDFTTDYVVNILNSRGIEYRRLNCEDILTYDLSFSAGSESSYSILGESTFDSVWFRRTKLPNFDGLSTEAKNYLLVEADNLIRGIFSIVSAKWLSPPLSVYQAENKLHQLEAAHKIGFVVPNTLVTNSREELRTFYENNRETIIIKPLAQTRLSNHDEAFFIFTNVVPKNVINKLDSFDLTPCIFQENIPKQYELRVTVVGEDVFAAAVRSQDDEESRTDWRRKRLKFETVELPSNIVKLCVRLLKELNLGFGAIDLIKTPDNEYVFLEINPNGQWVWIEAETNLKISEAIIRYLTNE